MAYKTRRENRYAYLRRSGFTKFEARPLSKVPRKITPYFRATISERKTMMKKAQKMGVTAKQFENQIKELYRAQGWLRKNRVGKTVYDPWQMFREAEDRHKAKHPEYDSPWEKRWRNWRQFQSKVEKTLERQRRFA
jgi:hypothetical protein